MGYTSSIYWLTRLDGINGLFMTLLVLGIILLFLYFMAMGISNDFDRDDMKDFSTRYKWSKRWFIIMIIFGGLGATFTPTTKEAIFIIAGGKTLDYVSKDTSLNKIPGQISTITSTWLEKKLNELETDVKTKIENSK